jgi:osomolarity two-component system sensor histidine kinase SLN1
LVTLLFLESNANPVTDVTLAKDGQEALDIVREAMAKGERFDLVFMDIQMPNLDGIQSTKLIREMGFSAPIVALTAFAEESNMKECMESGMDFFLPKPIRRPALKQVLKRFTTIPEEDGEGAMANGTDDAGDPNGRDEQNAEEEEEPSSPKPNKAIHTIQDTELNRSSVLPTS